MYVHVFMNPVIKVKVIKVIKDFGFQNIPLSYKIRLNQVRPANKIHPYNLFSDFFFVFLQIYCANMGVEHSLSS